MKSKLLVIVLLFVVVSGIGCRGTHPADVVAPVIQTTHKGYDIANKTLFSFHDACVAAGENCPAQLQPIVTNWNQIADIGDRIDEQFTKVENAWLTLSGLDSPENKAEFEAQLQLLNQLFDELAALIPGVNISRFVPNNIEPLINKGE